MSQTRDVDAVYQGDKETVKGTLGVYGNNGSTPIFITDPVNYKTNSGTTFIPAAAIDPNISDFVNGSANSYFGMQVNNFANAATTTADIALQCNVGTGNSGTFVDLGMTAAGWNDSQFAVFDANSGYLFTNSGNLFVGAGTAGTLNLFAGGMASKANIGMSIDINQNVVAGTGAVGSAGTAGFFFIRGGAGVPTGTPQAKTGMVPMYFDTTNNNFYMYNGASWKKASSGGTWA